MKEQEQPTYTADTLPHLHVLEVFCDALVFLCELAVLITVLAVAAGVLALEVDQHVVLAGQLALLLVDGGGVLCSAADTAQPVHLHSRICDARRVTTALH